MIAELLVALTCMVVSQQPNIEKTCMHHSATRRKYKKQTQEGNIRN